MWTSATREHYSRRTMRYQSDLTDAEGVVTEPHLSPARCTVRPRSWEVGEIVHAIFSVMRGGIAWRLVPIVFSFWRTFYRRFAAWRNDWVFEKIKPALVIAD